MQLPTQQHPPHERSESGVPSHTLPLLGGGMPSLRPLHSNLAPPIPMSCSPAPPPVSGVPAVPPPISAAEHSSPAPPPAASQCQPCSVHSSAASQKEASPRSDSSRSRGQPEFPAVVSQDHADTASPGNPEKNSAAVASSVPQPESSRSASVLFGSLPHGWATRRTLEDLVAAESGGQPGHDRRGCRAGADMRPPQSLEARVRGHGHELWLSRSCATVAHEHAPDLGIEALRRLAVDASRLGL